MEPLTAILSFAGSAVGGLFNFLGADRQARVAETQISADLQAKQSYFEAWLDSVLAQERAARAAYRRDTALGWISGDVAETRAYYSYQTANTLRGSVVAVAGVGLLALATYLAMKEG
ncbi:hypothetical protein [Oceanithermus sp.]